MKKKNNYNFLLFGIIFIFFGLSMLIYGKTIPTIMIILLGYLLIIKSLFNFMAYFLSFLTLEANIFTCSRVVSHMIAGISSYLLFS